MIPLSQFKANLQAARSTLRVKDHVFDAADERHVGVILSINLTDRFATVRWVETGFKSFAVPLASLRVAPTEMYADKPGQCADGNCQQQMAAVLAGAPVKKDTRPSLLGRGVPGSGVKWGKGKGY